MEWVIVIIGVVLIGLFAYSNFALDEKWAAAAGGRAAMGERRTLRGIVEATLFFVGTLLIAGALTKMAISAGYGGF
jgi:hypothetical protein